MLREVLAHVAPGLIEDHARDDVVGRPGTERTDTSIGRRGHCSAAAAPKQTIATIAADANAQDAKQAHVYFPNAGL